MCCVCFVVLAYLINSSCGLNYLEGWNYINLHCRDDSSAPVDWWYIYKPPSDTIPYLRQGYNFTYITPHTTGKWVNSKRHINSNSMLQNTVSPMFRPTYVDYLAVMTYDLSHNTRKAKLNPAVLGMMLADQMGGFWIGHTVPGLPDFQRDRPLFPEKESANGHMLMCMSLDLVTLNQIALALKDAKPKLTRLVIPELIRPLLPEWEKLRHLNNSRKPIRRSKLPNMLNFSSRGKDLAAVMLTRQPGDPRCLYQAFAEEKSLVLDIYGHQDHKTPICKKKYSLRHIDSISLKIPEQVHYISNRTDRTGFAVSTAAHWSKTSSAPKQYWTCVNDIDDQATTGAIIMCVQSYKVWSSFDNFKVKEPKC